MYMYNITLVSQVSTHGRLNIIRDFDPHGRLPGTKIPYVCIEEIHGRLPRSGRLPETLQYVHIQVMSNL